MSDFVGQPSTPDQRLPDTLSVVEAGRILGVSDQTVRRRIKRGQLRAELMLGPSGREWRVFAEGPLAPIERAVEQVLMPPPSTDVERQTLNMLQHLMAEMVALRAEVAEFKAQQVLIPPPTAPRRAWWRVWGR